jgi:hypothetical protein
MDSDTTCSETKGSGVRDIDKKDTGTIGMDVKATRTAASLHTSSL